MIPRRRDKRPRSGRWVCLVARVILSSQVLRLGWLRVHCRIPWLNHNRRQRLCIRYRLRMLFDIWDLTWMSMRNKRSLNLTKRSTMSDKTANGRSKGMWFKLLKSLQNTFKGIKRDWSRWISLTMDMMMIKVTIKSYWKTILDLGMRCWSSLGKEVLDRL